MEQTNPQKFLLNKGNFIFGGSHNFMETLTLEQCRNCLKKLQEISVCQVCHEPLRSPDIVVCNNGHVICASCKQRVPCCAVCRSLFSNVKSATLCQMVEAIPRLCRNNYGCNRIVRDKDDHETWCEFRLLKCIYCSACVEGHTLLKHLSDAHEYQPPRMAKKDFQKIDFHCNTELQINIGVLKLYDGHMFNIHYNFSHTEKALMVYISFYPLKKVEDNIFKVKLELCSKNVSFIFCREGKVMVDKKSVVFKVADLILKDFNGKNVSFKTTISGRNVVKIEAETPQPITSSNTLSSPTPAKRVKVESNNL